MRLGGETGLEDPRVRIGAVEQIGPDPIPLAAIGFVKQRVGMRLRVEGNQRDRPAGKGHPLGALRGTRIDERADGLGGGGDHGVSSGAESRINDSPD